MTQRRAYEEVTLTWGSHAATLRPSLRAATLLEAGNGLEHLFQNLDAFRLTTIRRIILTATADRGAADALLTAVGKAPLVQVARAFHGPLTTLCLGFIPRTTPAEQSRSEPAEQPLAWAEVYRALFDRATGWLHWTPDAVWNATPTEIAAALEAHLEMLQAMHGAGDADGAAPSQTTPDQRAQNIADGLDPEFDREGLRALKARLAGGMA